jgi:FkbM family methyltransferase
MVLLQILKFLREHPLTRDRQLAAIRRFLSWQIGSRLVPGPVVVPYVNNTRLIIGHGMHGMTGNLYAGLFEFDIMSFLLHFLRPEDVFIDVGAFHGAYTVLASGVAGAKSIAIEPVPVTLPYLQDNIHLNQIHDLVELKSVAVGSHSETIEITTGLGSNNHIVQSADNDIGEVARVSVVPLDHIVEEYDPTMIKIDVEGYEAEVVAGGAITLAKPSVQAVLMESIGHGLRYDFDEGALHARMQEYGFEPYIYQPFDRQIAPSADTSPKPRNLIFIRDIEFVMDRVRTAPAL